MRTISAVTFVSLDGVAQGLGRPDEDTRFGFRHGGWGPAFNDDVMGAELAKGMSKPGDMLFGRRTWQDFITSWGGSDDNPTSQHLNAATKYVVSRTLDDVDVWQNSILLRGEAHDTVAELKTTDGPDLSIVGSIELVNALHAASLVDQFTLLIHPLTLGPGLRLFDGATSRADLELTRCTTTPKGVIIAEYTRRT